MCKVFLYVIKLYKSKHEKSYDYKYQFPNFTNNILISKNENGVLVAYDRRFERKWPHTHA